MNQNYHLDELVIGAGGMNGIYMVGALYQLSKVHSLDKFSHYTGCSIGSVIAFVINIGYDIEDIKNIIIQMDFGMFQDIKISNFLMNQGLDTGEKMSHLLKAILLHKNYSATITFQELYEKTQKTLTFVTCNITRGKSEYHNHIHTPDMSILLSLQMSMNVPILFSPIKYNDHYYVDGALLDPYPYHYFDGLRKIGIVVLEENQNDFLQNKESRFVENLDDSFQYIQKLLTIFHLNFLKKNINKKLNKDTIHIITVHATKHFDFSVENTDKIKMFERGKETFDKYYQKIMKKRRYRYLARKYIQLWKKFSLNNSPSVHYREQLL